MKYSIQFGKNIKQCFKRKNWNIKCTKNTKTKFKSKQIDKLSFRASNTNR